MRWLILILIVLLASPAWALGSHPRIWLTSTLLTTLGAKVTANSADWVALKAQADNYATQTVEAYTRSSCTGNDICYTYEGGDNPYGWYDAMVTLGVAYQATCAAGSCTASYATKALQILDAANAPWKNSSDLTPITLDTGYPTRNILTLLALGYDWFYSSLSSTEKTDTIATINAAYTWFSTGASPKPYCTAGDTCQGNPYMNYEGGHMLGFGLAADATDGDNSNSTTIYTFIESLYAAVIGYGIQSLPVTVTSYQSGNYNMTTGGYLGGAVPESYNYGSSGNERLWKLLLAWDTSGRNTTLLTTYTPWIEQSMTNLIYMLRPNLWQVGDEGDFPGNCSSVLHQDYPLFLAYVLNGTTQGAWAQYMYNNLATNACSTNPQNLIPPTVYDAMLWSDSTRTATNYTSTAALNYASSGDGHLFARSDWTTGAAYFSFNGSGGNFTDHMHSSAGNLEVVHGSDYLLVGAGAWQSTAGYGGTPSIEDRAAQYQSTLYFNDGGAYMYTGDPYTGGQALWGNTNVLASRADAHVSYMLGDLDSAYDIIPGNRVPANRTAQYYYREVGYLGGNAIFVQDRFLSKSSAYTMRLQWHLNPVTGAPTVSSNVISTVAGSSKLYIDTLLPSAYTITTARDVATSDGSTNLTYNMQVSNSSASTLLNGLTVIYATSSGGSLPTTTQLSTIDANHVGAQIQDTTPAVAVFAAPVTSLGSNTYAPTSYTSATFTTTHTGTANYLVAGMTPGTYSVTGPCASLCSSQVVGSDGTLYFTGTSGAYSIGAGGGSPSGGSAIGSGFLGAGVLQ